MGKILYWVGCMASYRVKEIAKSTVKILKHAQISFETLGSNETCCGSVLIRYGMLEEAEKLAKQTITTIKNKNINTVVTSCAGCYRTFAKDYYEYLDIKPPFTVLHTSQLLADIINNGKISVPDLAPLTVTYHDPCHLGRHMGIFEEPRQVIKAFNTKIIEMKNSYMNSNCCGAGGGLMSTYRELTAAIAEDRLREALETKTRYLITTCPFCVYNMRKTAETLNIPIQVMDLTEFIIKRIEGKL